MPKINQEEYESEETEVKKQKLIEKWESAIEAAEFYGKGKEDRLIEYMRNFVDDLNRLDEPEVLTQEFIDKYKVDYDNWMPAVPIVHLQNLLVPKQEDMFNGEKPDEGEVYFAIGLGGAVKINVARSIDEAIEILTKHEASYNVSKKPVIPKFVAEWIEETKPNNSLRVAFEYIAQRKMTDYDDELAFWVEEGNSETFARAWLDGFRVEEEPKYYAKIKGHEKIYSDICFWIYDTEIEELLIDDAEIYPDVTAGYMIKATKDEWANLGINDDNADFVKVEEMEE